MKIIIFILNIPNLLRYYFLRVFNFVIVRIPENIGLYPIKIFFEAIFYLRNLNKLNFSIHKHSHEKKLIKSNLIFPNGLIDHGILKAKINRRWLIDSEDDEIAFLPRRLFWLLYGYTESNLYNIDIYKSYLNRFIFDFSYSITRKNFSPYILSECISNLILFNRALNNNWTVDYYDQILFLTKANKLLVRSIEFRGPFSTCNHILNNFRALYLSRYSIHSKYNGSFFIALWQKISHILFSSNKVFNEGSMHYHYLITSWLFELCICAYETNDIIMLNYIKPYLKSNLDVISIFSKFNKIPLFGDISPDCPVNWLLPISKYANNEEPFLQVGKGSRGWDKIWNCE